MENGEHFVATFGGTTRREQRIFVSSWGILGVAGIQQEGALGQYMLGTGSVVGERRLSLTVHYSKEGLMPPGAPLMIMIKGWIVQEKKEQEQDLKMEM